MAAASCQVHEMGVGGLLLRLAWQRPASGWCYIGPDRRCLGRLACREIGRLPEGSSAPSGTAANVGSDGPAVPGKSRAGGVLKFGSERACAPPALSALNLRRLLRVVLPVKRDCSADNPNSAGDYSSCAHEE